MSSVAGNWHTLKLLLASWVVRQQKLATVPHLATMPIYALKLQGVFNSLEPHAHGEAQVDDFWQKMISRQCLQSQVTGTPWNCFLRRESCVNKSLPLCHILPLCHTMPYYAHLCPDVARSVQQSGATCSWWSTGGWFLTKNDITTVSSVAGNWHTLKLLLASWVVRQQKFATVPHVATMPYYAHLCPDVARSVQQSGATCSWWSTGGWFLTKNDITTVSSVAGNWHTLKLLLASWVVRQQKLATVPHLATIPIYALTLQGVFNSLEPHAHGEAQVDDFWQKMISRQCLQSQVTGTPWNCFLRRESCVNKSLPLCHILPLCPSMLWRCKECSTVWSHMLMVKHRWMISDKKWYHDSVFSRR